MEYIVTDLYGAIGAAVNHQELIKISFKLSLKECKANIKWDQINNVYTK